MTITFQPNLDGLDLKIREKYLYLITQTSSNYELKKTECNTKNKRD